MRPFLLAATAAGLLVGCGGAGAPITPPTAEPRTTWPAGVTELAFDEVLRYACGSFAFEPSFLEQVGHAEDGNDPMAMALRAHLETKGPDYEMLLDSGWLLLGADDRRAEFIAPGPDGRVDQVSVENDGSGWKVAGWGGCGPSLVIPEGLGSAEWLPDSRHPAPDSVSRTFHALVTERSCASGQPSVGRVVGPAIRSEPDRVLVAFGVIPQAGDAFECPSNPSTPVVFDLEEPLGDRQLIDASKLPYVDVRTVDPLGW